MPKKTKPLVQRVATRRQEARWRHEHRQQMITLAAGLGVIVVVLGILAYGYLATYYFPPRQAAVRVNDRVFNMTYVADLLRIVSSGGGSTAASMADQMPKVVQDNELARAGAAAEGVTATDQDVEQQLRSYFAPILPTPEEEPDAAKRETAFQKAYADYLKRIKISDQFFREIIKTDLLKQKLRDKLTPASAEQVHLMAIMVSSLDKTKPVKADLDAGKDFSTVARQYSEHSSKDQGGDLGWIPRGVQDSKIDDVAFSLAPGAVSDAFRTSLGFWVIKTVDKETDRPLSDDNKQALNLKVLDDWLGKQREHNRVESYWNKDKSQWLQNQFKTQA